MFDVKATYRGETRKFILRGDNFPSYMDLRSQLERVFIINRPYYLSKLLFSPSKGTSVIVGYDVYDEEEYNARRAPFSGRLWSNGLLRFNVMDAGEDGAQTQSAQDSHTEPVNEDAQPWLRPRPSASGGDQDEITRRHPVMVPNRQSFISESSQQSCCSVEEGKSEMKELMASFLRDFSNIASSTFGEVASSILPASSAVAATPSTSETDVPTLSATPRAGSEAQATSPAEDAGLGIPGAFVEFAAPTVSTDNSIHCGFCVLPIKGYYHKCNACADYNLCGVCFAFENAEDAHKSVYSRGSIEHSFSLVSNANEVVSTPRAQQSSIQETSSARNHVSEDTITRIHVGVLCDSCNQTIVGLRHKCLNCHNFDLCSACYPLASLSHNRHDFMTIKNPEAVSTTRVYSSGHSHLHRRQYTEPSSRSNLGEPVHQAICDLCDSRIQGFRYKCLTCPDYDTCASCYRIVGLQHPKHTFVKVESPQDLSIRDASAFVRHNAKCDECGKNIRGTRYKCMHPECPDFDLCAKCEALPIIVHPANHPLLKMRSPSTVIPTVYRVGGTQSITPAAMDLRPSFNGIAVSTDPEPRKADASVHAETVMQPATRGDMVDACVLAQLRPQTSEASISVTTAVPGSGEQTRDLPLFPTPPPHSPVLTASVESIAARPSEMIQMKNDVQQVHRGSDVPSLFATFVTRFAQREPGQDELRATFIGDVNVEDGHVFPSGTEFVKTWCMRNDGKIEWPETTNILFVAGDRMSSFMGASMSYPVGRVQVGEIKDVSVRDLKAPELAGKYIGYWRLTDGVKPFGQSVWCDITVPEHAASASLHASLSSSEVIMPEPTRAASAGYESAASATPDLVPSGNSTPATTIASAGPSSVSGYDSASDSLLDEFDTMSDDELWEATRTRQANGDYVVLYDNESTDEDAH